MKFSEDSVSPLPLYTSESYIIGTNLKNKMNAFQTNDFKLLMIVCTNKPIHNL